MKSVFIFSLIPSYFNKFLHLDEEIKDIILWQLILYFGLLTYFSIPRIAWISWGGHTMILDDKIIPTIELTGIFVFFIALIGAIFASLQVRQINNQTRANTLLNLDHRFESEPLIAAKKIFHDTLMTATNKPGAQNLQEKFSNELDAMSVSTDSTMRENYQKLFVLCGFFETVGFVAKTGMIKKSDVQELFGTSAKDTASYFKKHIIDLREKTGRSKHYFEYLLDLGEEMERMQVEP